MAAPAKKANGGFRSAEDQRQWRDYEPLRDNMVNRFREGLGFFPQQDPIVQFNQERDPTTGDYLSRSINAQFSDPLARLGNRYQAQINAQMGRDIVPANAVRQKVRANVAANQQSYTDPRLQQQYNWSISPYGQFSDFTMYQPIYDQLSTPFLPASARYV